MPCEQPYARGFVPCFSAVRTEPSLRSVLSAQPLPGLTRTLMAGGSRRPLHHRDGVSPKLLGLQIDHITSTALLISRLAAGSFAISSSRGSRCS
jgi:hypothetical protein